MTLAPDNTTVQASAPMHDIDEAAKHLFHETAAVTLPNLARDSWLQAVYTAGDAIRTAGIINGPAATLAAQAALHALATALSPGGAIRALVNVSQVAEGKLAGSEDDAQSGIEDADGLEGAASLHALLHLSTGFLTQADMRLLQKAVSSWMRAGCLTPIERHLHLKTTPKAKQAQLRNFWLRRCLRHLQVPWGSTPRAAARMLVNEWKKAERSHAIQAWCRSGVIPSEPPPAESNVAIFYVMQLCEGGPLTAGHVERLLKQELQEKCSR